MYQLNFINESATLFSIDPKKNRYRIYTIELSKLRPYKVTTRWGRVKPTRGKYRLRNNRWIGSQEKGFDSLETAETHYNTILKQKNRKGYIQN